jgi:FkbM family methyltransferase
MTWTPPCLFSQNFEDLYLWRLFKHIDQGFYIDVGAYHPEKHSVTKIFYDQGWRGINIEPVPEFFERFQRDRCQDINLPIAISSSRGKVDLNVYGDSGLASIDRSSRASAPPNFKELQQSIQVDSLPLYDVIKAYAPPRIDYIKVDVEGLEYDVVRSLSLDSLPLDLKPKVILLEVTIPLSKVVSASRDGCRSLLYEHGYKHFLFDGLNDYYCLESDYFRFSEISLPPNVFDGVPVTPEAFLSLRDGSARLREEIEKLTKDLDSQSKSYKARETETVNALKLLEKNIDSVSVDRDLLLQQVADLSAELLRVFEENIVLKAKIDRHEEKLVWLRGQREAAVANLAKANRVARNFALDMLRMR